MTYKQIEQSREIRMWITQIVVPAVVACAAIPQIREPIVQTCKSAWSGLKNKIHK